jgi:hypothetical protein
LGSVFVIMCFLMLPVIEGILIWQLWRLNKRAKGASGTAQVKDSKTNELGAAPVRSLAEAGDPVPSITEQTTRAFESSYREGKR